MLGHKKKQMIYILMVIGAVMFIYGCSASSEDSTSSSNEAIEEAPSSVIESMNEVLPNEVSTPLSSDTPVVDFQPSQDDISFIKSALDFTDDQATTFVESAGVKSILSLSDITYDNSHSAYTAKLTLLNGNEYQVYYKGTGEVIELEPLN